METKYKRQSIGRDKAIALANSGWWEGKTPRELAKFQLFTAELSMPFEVFHEALEKTLGRPVWTHELALNFDGIAMELLGEKDAPTMEEIINLIPEEKRILLVVQPMQNAEPVTIYQSQPCLCMTEEMRQLSKRIDDPQDLEDALLAVEVENAAAYVANHVETQILGLLFPQNGELSSGRQA